MKAEDAKAMFAPGWPVPDLTDEHRGETQLAWQIRNFMVILKVDEANGIITVSHPALFAHMNLNDDFDDPLDTYVSALSDPSVAKERMDMLHARVAPWWLIDSPPLTHDPVTMD